MISINNKLFKYLNLVIWILVFITFVAGFFISEKSRQNKINTFCESKNLIEVSENLYKADSTFYIFTQAKGYGGEILCMVKTDSTLIQYIKIINHSETKSYFKQCKEFITKFNNKNISKINDFPDAISGATLTSNAIKSAVLNAYYILYDKTPNTKNKFAGSKATPIIIAIILLSISTVYLKNRKLLSIINWVVLLLALATIGFFINKPLTLTLFSKLIIFQPPPLFSNIDTYLLLGYAIFSILFFRKNLYCKHVCPFGAFQECCAIAIKPTNKVKFGNIINRLPILLTGVALIPALLFRAPGLAQYEIYSGIFDFRLSLWLYLLFITVIVIMFFIKRPWCKLFCPTGAVLNYLLKIRIKPWKK